MAYLLDTNVFIQAWNGDYKPDYRPEFWEWLIQKNVENEVYSIKKVLDEIKNGDDGLVDWAKNLDDIFSLK